MDRDIDIAPWLGTALLASVVFASLYFLGSVVEAEDSYFYTFTAEMDRAIERAYGAPVPHGGESFKPLR